MTGVIYHIFGSGSALVDNPVFHARLDYVLGLEKGPNEVIVYGCKQPNRDYYEADTGVEYLTRRLARNVELMVDRSPKSISETVAIIAEHLHDDLAAKRVVRFDDGSGEFEKPHCVIINWPHMPRTKYLLRKQWARLYPDIPWAEVVPLVRFAGVGGTFVPFVRRDGFWRAVKGWLRNPVAYEIYAWIKAFRDPFDTRLNQDRRYSQWLGK